MKYKCGFMVLLAGLFCFSFMSHGQDDLLSTLRKKADQGDPSAQCNLGASYASGDIVPQDYKMAAYWYTKAAEQGDASAQWWLGQFYSRGVAVTRDAQVAAQWFRLAAEQEHPFSQFILGLCYSCGDGVIEDDQESLKWFLRAGKNGVAIAQYHVGVAYEQGKGVDQSREQAFLWYHKAAEQEFAEAELKVSVYYSKGLGVSQDDQKAQAWLKKAAMHGQPSAQFMLGCSYESGQGVLEDYIEAYAWYLIASTAPSEEFFESIRAMVPKIKESLKDRLNTSQITSAQQRAKELQGMIERKKQVSALGPNEMPSENFAPSGFGSGLLVQGGYVVTCWHVVDAGNKVTISCQGKDYAATVVQKDPANDIAVLRVTGAPEGVSLSLADSNLGANVFTMGFPHPDLQGSDVKFTTGSISGLTGPGNTPVYYQISVPLQSGNSGGPLFDEQGNLVGIVAAKLDSLITLAATGDLPQNVNYAIKADYLKPILKTVEGISIQPAKTKPADMLSLIEELKQSVVMIKVY